MGRKTTTVYSCDRCAKTVARPRDLTRFTIDVRRSTKWEGEETIEVCDGCRNEILDFLPGEGFMRFREEDD